MLRGAVYRGRILMPGLSSGCRTTPRATPVLWRVGTILEKRKFIRCRAVSGRLNRYAPGRYSGYSRGRSGQVKRAPCGQAGQVLKCFSMNGFRVTIGSWNARASISRGRRAREWCIP